MDNIFLKQHYNELLDQLNLLQQLMTKSEPQQAVVARIPPLTKAQEHEPLPTITPTLYNGQEALEAAIKAYKDLYIIAGLSQKSARRTPGVIYFDTQQTPHAAHIAECVDAINNAKLAIKDYVVSNFSTANARFEILKQACPGIMAVHLYRLIRCYYQDDLKSVRFNWSQQQALVYPDKKRLVKRINTALQHSTSTDYSASLSQLLNNIAAVPQDSIRIRRQVKVQPVANVTRYSGAAGPVTTPLPLIILQDSAPAIRSIGEFNAETAAQRKTRSDKLETQLLGYFQGETIEQVVRQK